jgi:hypothetical protein
MGTARNSIDTERWRPLTHGGMIPFPLAMGGGRHAPCQSQQSPGRTFHLADDKGSSKGKQQGEIVRIDDDDGGVDTPAPVPAYEAPLQQDVLAFAMPDGAVSSPAPLPSSAQSQIIDPFAPSTTRPSADQDLLGHTSTITTTPTTTITFSVRRKAVSILQERFIQAQNVPFRRSARPRYRTIPPFGCRSSIISIIPRRVRQNGETGRH